jgi:hypothetical protein
MDSLEFLLGEVQTTLYGSSQARSSGAAAAPDDEPARRTAAATCKDLRIREVGGEGMGRVCPCEGKDQPVF